MKRSDQRASILDHADLPQSYTRWLSITVIQRHWNIDGPGFIEEAGGP